MRATWYCGVLLYGTQPPPPPKIVRRFHLPCMFLPPAVHKTIFFLLRFSCVVFGRRLCTVTSQPRVFGQPKSKALLHVMFSGAVVYTCCMTAVAARVYTTAVPTRSIRFQHQLNSRPKAQAIPHIALICVYPIKYPKYGTSCIRPS